MQPYILGIAGGSGAGKSSLAYALRDAFPGNVTIFHLDDYFRPADEVPVRAGLKNWDDPKALYYSQMARDLAALKTGQAVTINTKAPDLNPEFVRSGQRIPMVFEPKSLIIVEGFLTLHFPKIRKLLDYSVYLDAPFALASARRVHSKVHPNEFPDDYNRHVLKPMQERYVNPTKVSADLVLNVEKLDKREVLKRVRTIVMPQLT